MEVHGRAARNLRSATLPTISLDCFRDKANLARLVLHLCIAFG